MSRRSIFSIFKFFICLLLFGVLVLSTHAAQATTALFDFNDDPPASGTPLTESDNGVTAEFTSPDDPNGFEIVPNPSFGFVNLGPDVLISNTATQLDISFSVPVQTISFNFVTDDYPFSPPYSILQVQAFNGSTPVASAFSEGTPQFYGDFPEGFVGLGAASFDNVVISTFNDNEFAIGNLEVTTNAAVAPETTTMKSFVLLILLGLTGMFCAKRKTSSRSL